jgi:predicted XRE-type DNA-binding protein
MSTKHCKYENNFVFQDKLNELGLRISLISPEQYVEISKLIGEEVSLAFAKKDLALYKDCEIEIKEILILKIIKIIQDEGVLKSGADIARFLKITKSRVSKIFNRSYSELSISYLVKIIFKLENPKQESIIKSLSFKKSA